MEESQSNDAASERIPEAGIESRVGEAGAKKAPIWDFLTAAYSANKAVKVGLAVGTYSLPLGIVSGAGVYLAVRTVGGVAKIAAKLTTGRYGKMREIGDDMSGMYRPFGEIGKCARPTSMGSLLSGITYATGF